MLTMHHYPLTDAQISYGASFLDDHTAYHAFLQLRSEINWRQEHITLFGKTHKVPRLSCWMADAGMSYAYSNMTMQAVSWHPLVQSIKQQVERVCCYDFNSVLLNYYRNGQDSNGWHSDDEPELGCDPVIASVSLGAPRDFYLRYKQNHSIKQLITLQPGSLLLMKGCTQRYWQHQVPKRAQSDGRINLTFRVIKNV